MASAAGGLTRRRGAGRVAGADEQDDSRVSSPISRNGSAMDNRGPETSFTSAENGHKIAFDPRDISENEERGKQPKLTLMEDILLLGLKDKQVSLHGYYLMADLFDSWFRPLTSRPRRNRVICRSGTKTSPMPCEGVSLLSSRSAAV